MTDVVDPARACVCSPGEDPEDLCGAFSCAVCDVLPAEAECYADRLTPEQVVLAQTWAVLERHCGASPAMFSEFASAFPGCGEFRFQGSLGFGGKIYASSDNSKWWVGCYREDATTERLVAVRDANAELAALAPGRTGT